LKLIKKHGGIDAALRELDTEIKHLKEIRNLFLHPDVTSDYELRWKKADGISITRFLCEKHDFSEARVSKAVDRLLEASDEDKRPWINGFNRYLG